MVGRFAKHDRSLSLGYDLCEGYTSTVLDDPQGEDYAVQDEFADLIKEHDEFMSDTNSRHDVYDVAFSLTRLKQKHHD